MAPRVARRHPPVLVLPPPSSIRDDDNHIINIDRNSKQHEHSQQTTTNDANANLGEFERVESIFEGSGDNDSVVMFSPSSTTLRDTHNNNEGVLLHSRSGRMLNDKGLDVYEQLDEFEHLLDVELESMEKLGFFDGNRCASSAAAPFESGSRMQIATSRSGTAYDSKYRGEDYDESDSDSCEVTNNVNVDGDHSDNDDSARSYQCNNSDDEEARMTLLPPPSSWFLRLDEDGDGNIIHSDGAIKSATDDNNDPNSQKRCNPSFATSDSADDDAATAPPATATDHPPATASTATIASTSQFESMLSRITALSSNTTPTTTTISIATTLLTSLISQTNITQYCRKYHPRSYPGECTNYEWNIPIYNAVLVRIDINAQVILGMPMEGDIIVPRMQYCCHFHWRQRHHRHHHRRHWYQQHPNLLYIDIHHHP